MDKLSTPNITAENEDKKTIDTIKHCINTHAKLIEVLEFKLSNLGKWLVAITSATLILIIVVIYLMLCRQ